MKFSSHTIQIFLLLACTSFIFSCRQDGKPDISSSNLKITIARFDKDLSQGKHRPVEQVIKQLNQQYPVFFQDYVHRVFAGSQMSPNDILLGLYADPAYSDLQKETDSVYPDLKPYETELTKSFRYIKYYYPATKIPRFISFISGFAYQTIVGDDYIGIGLDMFLGRNSQFYGGIIQSVPRYISVRFTPEYLVPRTVETFTRENLFPPTDDAQTLLAKMIYNGKILYFLDQILPEGLSDTIKIGYTDKQLRWCETYHKEIWGYFMENNLLFNSNYQQIQKYLSEAPFTPGVGVNKESAPKLGVWTGWQIIRAYMKNNPEITLQELMANNDAQGILNKSKYRP